MSLCCSPALEELMVFEPVALLKPSKSSLEPPVMWTGLLEGSGELKQGGSCGHQCSEPAKCVCIMIHLWLGSVLRKMSMWDDYLQQVGVFVIYLG